jgi:type VI protein secretion system component VasK
METAKKTLGFKDPTQSKLAKAAEAVLQPPGGAALLTRTDLQTMLQPVLLTVPPPFDHPVNPNDEAYVKALRDLGDASGGLARAASTPEKPAALQKALEAVAKAREARSGLVDRFPDSPNGLRDPLAELLLQPIQFAEAIIRQNSDISGAPKKNDDLARLCRDLRPILAKYPFNPRDEGKGATPDDLKKAFAPNGLVAKYEQSAADFLVRQGQEWQEKPNPGFSVTPELLNFVNSAQKLTGAFFASAEPAVEFTLRPTEGQSIKIELTLDGRKMEGVFQVKFRWPGEPKGALGRVVSPATYGFGNFDDSWGTFRLFQNADTRPLGSGKVVWSVIRGLGNAKPQPLDPPVRVDIVGNSSALDVLNPMFFQGLHSCPVKAVVAN